MLTYLICYANITLVQEVEHRIKAFEILKFFYNNSSRI